MRSNPEPPSPHQKVRFHAGATAVLPILVSLACGSATSASAGSDSTIAGSSQGGSAGDGASRASGGAGLASAGGAGRGGTSSGGAAGHMSAGDGAAGHTSAGGGGGAPDAPPCPIAAPASATSCASNGQVCFYEDCSGAGRSVATCRIGTWTVDVGPCEAVQCAYPANMTCPSGQLCSVAVGGTLTVRCVENSCGTGPITCDCVSSCAGCLVTGDLNRGVSLSCSTCPSGTCA